MCKQCGCGSAQTNQDDNYGTVDPYGIKGAPVNSPTTLGEK